MTILIASVMSDANLSRSYLTRATRIFLIGPCLFDPRPKQVRREANRNTAAVVGIGPPLAKVVSPAAEECLGAERFDNVVASIRFGV